MSSLESEFKKLWTRTPDTPDTCERQPNPERKGCGFKNIRIRVNWKLWYPLISLWDWNKNYFDRHKAIPIKCFFSHRPVTCDGGSIGRPKKKRKNEWTLAGVWVPQKAGLLSKKAWLQSQLENVVFSTFYTLLAPVRFKCWIALSTGQITIQRISIRKTKCASPLRYRFIQCRCLICLIHMPPLDKLGQGSAWTGN